MTGNSNLIWQMRNTSEIVINTGPIISLVAATGNLDILQRLYQKVFVPLEVKNEIFKESSKKFAANEFSEAEFLINIPTTQVINPFLKNMLDDGEAAVIQLALNQGVETVCLDEKAGRRIAKLNNLKLTGSIGILLKAKKMGYRLSIKDSIYRMKEKGIYLSENVIKFALNKSGEM